MKIIYLSEIGNKSDIYSNVLFTREFYYLQNRYYAFILLHIYT